MFEYNQIKQIILTKQFLICMLILQLLVLIVFFPALQGVFTSDDTPFLTSDTTGGLFTYGNPRAFGSLLSAVFGNGRIHNNLLVLVNITGGTFLALLFFIRMGIKNNLLLIMLSAILMCNTGMGSHFTFQVNVIRLIPFILMLSLYIAIPTKLTYTNILLPAFILFVTIWTYQLTILMYMFGITFAASYSLLNKKPLLQIIIHKIIPGIITIVLAFILYKLAIHITHADTDLSRGTSFHFFFSNSPITIYHELIHRCVALLYNALPFKLHIFKTFHVVLFCLLILSSIIYIYNKHSILSLFLMCLAFLIIIIINLILSFVTFGPRVAVPMYAIYAFIIYYIFNAYKYIKFQGIIIPIAIVCLYISYSLINATAYNEDKMLSYDLAVIQQKNRILNDLENTYRNSSLNTFKIFVFSDSSNINSDNPDNNNYMRRYHGDTKIVAGLYGAYLATQSSSFVYNLMYALGGYDIIIPTKKELFEACKKIDSMEAWPHKNSIIISDKIIFLSLSTIHNMKTVCNKNYIKQRLDFTDSIMRFKDGYLQTKE